VHARHVCGTGARYTWACCTFTIVLTVHYSPPHPLGHGHGHGSSQLRGEPSRVTAGRPGEH
jgi:hypothetical protein